MREYTCGLVFVIFGLIIKNAERDDDEDETCDQEIFADYYQVHWQDLVLWSYPTAVRNIERDDKQLRKGKCKSRHLPFDSSKFTQIPLKSRDEPVAVSFIWE